MSKRYEQHEQSSRMSANLEIPLTLTDEGRYFVKYNDKILIEGTYTISGDKIILTDERREDVHNQPEAAAGKHGLS